MKNLTLPLLLLLPLAGLAVLTGGAEGAGVAALAGVFLIGFSFLLLRREESRFLRLDQGFNERREADVQFLGFVVLFSAILRIGLALGMRYAGVNEAIAPDEYTFHDNGRYFLGWLEGEFSTPFSYRWAGTSDVGYFVVVGSLYFVFGAYEIVPILLNCLLGAACAFPAYRLAGTISGRRGARVAAVLVAFFPSLLLWSTLLIRDAPALFLVLWSVVFCQQLMRRITLRTLLLLTTCLGMLATLRAYLFVLIVAAALFSFVLAAIRKPGRAFAAAIGAALAATVLVQGLGLGEDTIARATLEHISVRREWNSIGAGGIGQSEFDLRTPAGALAYLPYGMLWFLFSPFPWQSSGRQALAVPDVLLWYVCMPLVVIGIVYALRRRRRAALVPVMAAVLITILHSLWEGNVGIIFRHRAHVLVLFLPFVGVAVVRLKQRARARARAIARTRAAAVYRSLYPGN